MFYELEPLLEDAGFVAERFLPDGVRGYIIETPGGTSVVDERLARGVGGMDDGVAYAAGTLLGEGEILSVKR